MDSTVSAPHHVEPPAGTVSSPLRVRLSRALWAIGGFDSGILLQPACATIRSKYSCMGALVFLTAALAAASGGYALYTVFKTLYIVIPAAVVWSTLVFFLDRFLVSSTRKTATMTEFSVGQRAAIPYRASRVLTAVVIRLALASIIGIIVAKPIEARLVQPLVDDYHADQLRTRLGQVINQPASADTLTRVAILMRDAEALRQSILKKEAELAEAAAETVRELNGESASGRPRGDGEYFHIKTANEQRLRTELGALVTRRDDVERQIETLQNDQRQQITTQNDQREAKRSFVSDYGTIREIQAEGTTRAQTLSRLSLFLTVLFVMIEMSPVLAKSLSAYDPYDAALQAGEQQAILRSLVSASLEHQAADRATKQ